jgi:hypothetical protein
VTSTVGTSSIINQVSDLQLMCMNGVSRINGEIFGHHHSLQQCSNSNVVQDDEGAMIIGEIFLFILAR